MNEEKYEQYALIKHKIKQLEKEESDLKKQILQELQDNKVKDHKTGFGTFINASKKVWSYSEDLQKKEEAVKIQKVDEQEKGIAKAKESHYLMFKPQK